MSQSRFINPSSLVTVATLGAILVYAATGVAQQPAAGGAAAPAAAPQARAAAPVAAAHGAAAKPAPAPTIELPKPNEAEVQTILDTNPKTPAELMQAVVALVQLDRLDAAKPLLQQLLNSKPDAITSADLIHRFGGATILQLADDPRLQPEGALLARQILGAAATAAHDPARLAAAVQQLASPSADVQRSALATLHDGGAYSVPPLLAAIIDPAQASFRSLAEGAVVSLGSDAIKPLVAVLADNDSPRVVEAIRLLAAIGDKGSAIYLLAPCFAADSPPAVRQAASQALQQLLGTTGNSTDAVTLLAREAQAYLDGQRVLGPDDGFSATVWNDDPATKQFAVAAYSPKWAAAFVALRLATDLRRLEPDSIDARRLYLVSLLESAVYRVGLDAPLPTGPGSACGRAAELGPAAVSDALAQAIDMGRPAAVQAAARVLQQIGDARVLLTGGPQPCPLVEALRSKYRRVRFAAAAAIMSFHPRQPFPGSSYLTDSAANLATATGRRRAVIGFPTTPTAQQLAGLAAASGYEPQTANLGFGVFDAATQSTDTEIVLISGRIARPGAFDLIQQLRGDPRSALLPVCVMGELADYPLQMKRFATEPKVFVVLRPEKPAEMAAAMAKGVQLSGDEIIPPALRLRDSITALDWLAEMALSPPEVFDVRRYEPVVAHALYFPPKATHAAAVLARLGTHSSQLALVDLASVAVQSIEVRQAAAAAFAESVRRFGLRLTPSEVVRQYNRYNDSRRLDKTTQQLLSGILDSIEAPTKKNKAASVR